MKIDEQESLVNNNQPEDLDFSKEKEALFEY